MLLSFLCGFYRESSTYGNAFIKAPLCNTTRISFLPRNDKNAVGVFGHVAVNADLTGALGRGEHPCLVFCCLGVFVFCRLSVFVCSVLSLRLFLFFSVSPSLVFPFLLPCSGAYIDVELYKQRRLGLLLLAVAAAAAAPAAAAALVCCWPVCFLSLSLLLLPLCVVGLAVFADCSCCSCFGVAVAVAASSGCCRWCCCRRCCCCCSCVSSSFSLSPPCLLSCVFLMVCVCVCVVVCSLCLCLSVCVCLLPSPAQTFSRMDDVRRKPQFFGAGSLSMTNSVDSFSWRALL